MENDIHIKKFFEDIYNEPTMYDGYKKGTVFLNHELYSKWYKEMSIRSESFAKAIREMDRPRTSEFVFETALSSNLTLSKSFPGKKEIEVKEFCMPKIETRPLGDDTHHYICNGCYETTLDNIYKVLNKGSFTVGICSEKKTDEFREIVKYYNQLRDHLMKTGYATASFESNISKRNKVYLLMYDYKKHNKHKK